MPSNTYKVKAGDNLAKIARRHGYPSWRVIYNHPDNATFRRKRPNPHLIQPGDVLVLPDIDGIADTVATLTLPWNFARRFNLSPRLHLQPVYLPMSGPLPPHVPAGLRPPFRRPAPRPGSMLLAGRYHDHRPPLGGPITGGYQDALKWTGKALLRYPYVEQRVDDLKDWGIDFVWRSRTPLGKGISIGLALTGASLLLSFEPSREFVRGLAHDTDIGLGPLGLEGVSLRPLLGIDGNWGGAIHFDLLKLGD